MVMPAMESEPVDQGRLLLHGAAAASSRPRNSGKRAAFAATSSAVAIIMVLLLFEATLRAASPSSFNKDWIHVKQRPGDYIFHNAHGTVPVHINRYGMRGPEVSPTKPEGTVRVLGIGDSTTWGWAMNYEDTYLEAARRALEEKSGGGEKFEFLNLSYPGTGLLEYRRYWENVGCRLQPDVVVIGFFMANDMFSVKEPYVISDQRKVKADRRGALEAVDWFRDQIRIRREAIAELGDKLTGRESAARDLYDLWIGPPAQRIQSNPLREEWLVEAGKKEGLTQETVLARLNAIPAELRERALVYDLDPWPMVAAVLHPQSMRESQEMAAPHVMQSWEAALEELGELIDAIRASGATPVVLAIPRGEQVLQDYTKDAKTLGFDVPADIGQTEKPQQFLQSYVKKRGCAFVDALPMLRRAAKTSSERLYFHYDVHLTAAGNKVLGETLAELLGGALGRHESPGG